jgi:hypothetical protein
MSILSYQELRALMSASLLSGRPPSEWDQALPLADAMATRLLDMAGIPKPGGVHPNDDEVRLDLARARAQTPPLPRPGPRKPKP